MAKVVATELVASNRWGHAFCQFLCGLFLANCIPHLVQAMCGHPFPSPFATPPGEGLSSPLVNCIWGLVNLVIAYALGFVGRFDARNLSCAMFFFVGFALCAVPLTVHFAQVFALPN